MTLRKFYRKTYQPLEYTLDGAIRKRCIPIAYGPWMPGVESIKTINGLHVPVVTLPDGTEELLSRLVLKYDERNQERPKGPMEHLLDFVTRKAPQPCR